LCYGIKGEAVCLPCLQPDCEGHVGIKEDVDSMCSICYTDALVNQPSIQLSCNHTFHYSCVRKLIELQWSGAKIGFGFRACPLCKEVMRHPGLKDLNDPLDVLYEAVKTKASMRLKFEKLDTHPDIINPNGQFYGDAIGFAMKKYAYYKCYKCGKPYYGGEAACVAALGHNVNFDPSELLCSACSPILIEDCPKHGKDYIEFKCRYCCSIAVWFCFGTTHFCEPCHNNNGKLTRSKKEELVQCPCVPKDNYSLPQKIEGSCPLGINHPAHGEEFCLGCGLCRGKDF